MYKDELSVFIPNSFLSESKDLKVRTFKVGILGRALAVFQIDNVEMTAELVHYCVKGIEVPYIRGQIGAHLDDETRNRYVSNIVFGALHRTKI